MDRKSTARDIKGLNPKFAFTKDNDKHQNKNKNFKKKDFKPRNTAQPLKNKFGGTSFNPKHDKKHKGALAQALEEYKSKKQEEHRQREENKHKKEEMNKALQRYKEKKAQKLKRLNKKTKKGQPIMKYWIEDMLQKIQSTS
ncbi:thyroid transcription factor 1-associated protein 26-like [Macrosteles quadrilineatus]|uniref:thyroid transcription factor 1-associated protein 26-like n=1 Tax=Macrosteles quadrilineatus TaxID=74068 RepID=UPI0023E17A19|nr:thyroid transcription factor 1-associated protein 26-like [Macrosteles quadrilineatus]